MKADIYKTSPNTKVATSYLFSPRSAQTINNTSFVPYNQRESLDIVDDLLIKSANKSYIGRMSGNPHLASYRLEEHQTIREEIHDKSMEQSSRNKRSLQEGSRNKRIHFSSLNHTFPIHEQPEIDSTIQETTYIYLKTFTFSNQSLNPSSCNACKSASNAIKINCQIREENCLELSLASSNELFLSLNFDTVNVQIEYESKSSNKELLLLFGRYVLILEHEDKSVIEGWWKRLLDLRDNSLGHAKQLVRLIQKPQFFRCRYQVEEQFVSQSQTGDLILFEDSHFFAKMQRFFTRSDFDHVGMIIKDRNYGTLILESNSGSGVCLTPWKCVIKYGWYETIPRIVWRKLEDVDRDEHFNQIVHKFVLSNLQKSYHISLDKLLSNQSYIAKDKKEKMESQQNQPNQPKTGDDGFFCSELIAALYKDLGLLTRDTNSKNYKPACNFIPYDFTQKSKINLEKGNLSPEYQIYFDPILLKDSYKDLKISLNHS